MELSSITDLIAEALEAHVPREVFFGYPVEPGEVVEEGYIETCMCGEKYPCDTVCLVKALEKVTAERDGLAAQVENARGLIPDVRESDDELADVLDEFVSIAPDIALDRVKAEALRGAIEDIDSAGLEAYAANEVVSWLRDRADRIERGESNE